MNLKTMGKRLQQLEVRLPPRQRSFIRILYVKPGGEITGEYIVEIGGSGGPIPTPPPLPNLPQCSVSA